MKKDLITERLRKAGFRATRPRLGILAYLAHAKYPVSIQELHGALRNKRIDQVTVYRTVEALATAGLIREIAAQHGTAHYEYNDPDSDHDHIVCASCHTVEDLEGMHAPGIERKALQKSHSFSRINAHALTLYGLCKACAA